MKIIKFLIILILLSKVAVSQQITKKYKIKKPILSTQNNYTIINIKNATNIASAGNPILPFINVVEPIPDNFTVKEIKFNYHNKISLANGITIYPKQPDKPLFKTKDTVLFNKNAYLKTYKPKKKPFFTVQTFRGQRFLITHFSPIVYNAKKGKTNYFSTVNMKIKLKPAEKPLKPAEKKTSFLTPLANTKIFSSFVPNPFNYEMLIIAPDEYTSDFDSLITLHKQMGIRSKIVSLSEIYSHSYGIDNPEKIRNFIKNEYQNYGIEFVLLAGDANLVPYRNLYCQAYSGGTIYSGQLPADLYFSALDGTWNDDQDDKWGEPTEADLLPDIAVGRITYGNKTELNNILHKIISYSKNPVLNGELNNPLLAGEKLYNDPLTYGSDYLELLISNHSDNGYFTVGMPDTLNFTKMYYKNGFEWQAQDILNEMNKGHSFVWHVGHSSATYMMKLYNNDITDANFSELNGLNHNYTLIYSHGCICGAFDYEDCISEKMLNIQNCAVGVFTNSRYGWFNEGQTEGPSEHLNREFVSALYGDSLNFAGIAEMMSKYKTAPWVGLPDEFEPGAQRWVFYDHNALTDPALRIWTRQPQKVIINCSDTLTACTPFEIKITDTLLNPIKKTLCVLMKNNKIIAEAYTNSEGKVLMTPDCGQCQTGTADLYVSGYNIILTHKTIIIDSPLVANPVITYYNFIDSSDLSFDFMDTVWLNLKIKNIGLQKANNIFVKISTNDTATTILTDSLFIGNIANGDSLTAKGLKLCVKQVKNSYKGKIKALVISDDTLTQTLYYKVNAPDFVFLKAEANDYDGNNDGYTEAGETGILNIKFFNIGESYNKKVNLNISSNYEGVKFSTNDTSIVAQADTLTVNLPFTIVDTMSQARIVKIKISGFFFQDTTLSFYVGKPVEDFESGNLKNFAWQTNGTAGWYVQNQDVYDGNYSSISGEMPNGGKSQLTLHFSSLSDGYVSFVTKTICNQGDTLYFIVDGQTKKIWTKSTYWQNYSFELKQGKHTISWLFVKNSNDGKAILDNIVMPAFFADYSSLKTIKTNEIFKIYPNPFVNRIHINSKTQHNCRIKILNVQGKIILTKNISVPIDLSLNLPAGIYLLMIEHERKTYVYKIIRQKNE